MGQGRFLAAVLLAFAAGCGHAAKNKAIANQEMDLATNKMKNGQPEQAVADLTDAHRRDPNNCEVIHLLGLAYWDKGRTMKDEALLLEAEKQVLESFKCVGEKKVPGDWHNNLGALYIDLRRWPEAVVQLQKAKEDPEYRTPERPLNNLGKAALEQGKWQEAISYEDTALRLQPRFCMAHINRGLAYKGSKKLEPALDDFEAVIKECPELPEPYLRSGEIYILLHRQDRAKQRLNEAAKRDPDGDIGGEGKKLLHEMNSVDP